MDKPIYLSDMDIEETLTEHEARYLEAHGLIYPACDLDVGPDERKYIINHDVAKDEYDAKYKLVRQALDRLRKTSPLDKTGLSASARYFIETDEDVPEGYNADD